MSNIPTRTFFVDNLTKSLGKNKNASKYKNNPLLTKPKVTIPKGNIKVTSDRDKVAQLQKDVAARKAAEAERKRQSELAEKKRRQAYQAKLKKARELKQQKLIERHEHKNIVKGITPNLSTQGPDARHDFKDINKSLAIGYVDTGIEKVKGYMEHLDKNAPENPLNDLIDNKHNVSFTDIIKEQMLSGDTTDWSDNTLDNLKKFGSNIIQGADSLAQVYYNIMVNPWVKKAQASKQYHQLTTTAMQNAAGYRKLAPTETEKYVYIQGIGLVRCIYDKTNLDEFGNPMLLDSWIYKNGITNIPKETVFVTANGVVIPNAKQAILTDSLNPLSHLTNDTMFKLDAARTIPKYPDIVSPAIATAFNVLTSIGKDTDRLGSGIREMLRNPAKDMTSQDKFIQGLKYDYDNSFTNKYGLVGGIFLDIVTDPILFLQLGTSGAKAVAKVGLKKDFTETAFTEGLRIRSKDLRKLPNALKKESVLSNTIKDVLSENTLKQIYKSDEILNRVSRKGIASPILKKDANKYSINLTTRTISEEAARRGMQATEQYLKLEIPKRVQKRLFNMFINHDMDKATYLKCMDNFLSDNHIDLYLRQQLQKTFANAYDVVIQRKAYKVVQSIGKLNSAVNTIDNVYTKTVAGPMIGLPIQGIKKTRQGINSLKLRNTLTRTTEEMFNLSRYSKSQINKSVDDIFGSKLSKEGTVTIQEIKNAREEASRYTNKKVAALSNIGVDVSTDTQSVIDSYTLISVKNNLDTVIQAITESISDVNSYTETVNKVIVNMLDSVNITDNAIVNIQQYVSELTKTLSSVQYNKNVADKLCETASNMLDVFYTNVTVLNDIEVVNTIKTYTKDLTTLIDGASFGKELNMADTLDRHILQESYKNLLPVIQDAFCITNKDKQDLIRDINSVIESLSSTAFAKEESLDVIDLRKTLNKLFNRVSIPEETYVLLQTAYIKDRQQAVELLTDTLIQERFYNLTALRDNIKDVVKTNTDLSTISSELNDKLLLNVEDIIDNTKIKLSKYSDKIIAQLFEKDLTVNRAIHCAFTFPYDSIIKQYDKLDDLRLQMIDFTSLNTHIEVPVSVKNLESTITKMNSSKTDAIIDKIKNVEASIRTEELTIEHNLEITNCISQLEQLYKDTDIQKLLDTKDSILDSCNTIDDLLHFTQDIYDEYSKFKFLQAKYATEELHSLTTDKITLDKLNDIVSRFQEVIKLIDDVNVSIGTSDYIIKFKANERIRYDLMHYETETSKVADAIIKSDTNNPIVNVLKKYHQDADKYIGNTDPLIQEYLSTLQEIENVAKCTQSYKDLKTAVDMNTILSNDIKETLLDNILNFGYKTPEAMQSDSMAYSFVQKINDSLYNKHSSERLALDAFRRELVRPDSKVRNQLLDAGITDTELFKLASGGHIDPAQDVRLMQFMLKTQHTDLAKLYDMTPNQVYLWDIETTGISSHADKIINISMIPWIKHRTTDYADMRKIYNDTVNSSDVMAGACKINLSPEDIDKGLRPSNEILNAWYQTGNLDTDIAMFKKDYSDTTKPFVDEQTIVNTFNETIKTLKQNNTVTLMAYNGNTFDTRFIGPKLSAAYDCNLVDPLIDIKRELGLMLNSTQEQECVTILKKYASDLQEAGCQHMADIPLYTLNSRIRSASGLCKKISNSTGDSLFDYTAFNVVASDNFKTKNALGSDTVRHIDPRAMHDANIDIYARTLGISPDAIRMILHNADDPRKLVLDYYANIIHYSKYVTDDAIKSIAQTQITPEVIDAVRKQFGGDMLNFGRLISPQGDFAPTQYKYLYKPEVLQYFDIPDNKISIQTANALNNITKSIQRTRDKILLHSQHLEAHIDDIDNFFKGLQGLDPSYSNAFSASAFLSVKYSDQNLVTKYAICKEGFKRLIAEHADDLAVELTNKKLANVDYDILNQIADELKLPVTVLDMIVHEYDIYSKEAHRYVTLFDYDNRINLDRLLSNYLDSTERINVLIDECQDDMEAMRKFAAGLDIRQDWTAQAQITAMASKPIQNIYKYLKDIIETQGVVVAKEIYKQTTAIKTNYIQHKTASTLEGFLQQEKALMQHLVHNGGILNVNISNAVENPIVKNFIEALDSGKFGTSIVSTHNSESIWIGLSKNAQLSVSVSDGAVKYGGRKYKPLNYAKLDYTSLLNGTVLDNTLRDSLIQALRNVELISGGSMADTLGEIIGPRYYSNIYDNMPKDFAEQIIPKTVMLNGELWKDVRPNRMLLSMSGAYTPMDNVYSYNTIDMLRRSLGYLTSRNQTELGYVSYYAGSRSCMQLTDIFGTVSNKEILDSLNRCTEVVPVAIIADKSRRGYHVERLEINTVADVEQAIRLQATLTPVQVYEASFNYVNDVKITNPVLHAFQVGVTTWKGSTLVKPFTAVRNYFDETFKTFLDTGVSEVPNIVTNQLRAMDHFVKYHKMMQYIRKTTKRTALSTKEITNFYSSALPDNLKLLDQNTFREMHGFIVDGASGGGDAYTSRRILLEKRSQLYKKMKSVDITGNLNITADLTNVLHSDTVPTKEKFRYAGQVAASAPFALMSATEQVARYAHFLTLNDMGITKTQSFERISRTHFNYDLKSKSTRYAELVIPFYNFLKLNLDYWGNAVLENPRMMHSVSQMYMHMRDNCGNDVIDNGPYLYDTEDTEDDARLQQLASGNIPIMDMCTEDGIQVYLRLNPSMFDAYNFLLDPVNQSIQKMLPILQVALQDTPGFSGMMASGMLDTYYGNGLEAMLPYYGTLIKPVMQSQESYEKKLMGTDIEWLKNTTWLSMYGLDNPSNVNAYCARLNANGWVYNILQHKMIHLPDDYEANPDKYENIITTYTDMKYWAAKHNLEYNYISKSYVPLGEAPTWDQCRKYYQQQGQDWDYVSGSWTSLTNNTAIFDYDDYETYMTDQNLEYDFIRRDWVVAGKALATTWQEAAEYERTQGRVWDYYRKAYVIKGAATCETWESYEEYMHQYGLEYDSISHKWVTLGESRTSSWQKLSAYKATQGLGWNSITGEWVPLGQVPTWEQYSAYKKSQGLGWDSIRKAWVPLNQVPTWNDFAAYKKSQGLGWDSIHNEWVPLKDIPNWNEFAKYKAKQGLGWDSIHKTWVPLNKVPKWNEYTTYMNSKGFEWDYIKKQWVKQGTATVTTWKEYSAYKKAQGLSWDYGVREWVKSDVAKVNNDKYFNTPKKNFNSSINYSMDYATSIIERHLHKNDPHVYAMPTINVMQNNRVKYHHYPQYWKMTQYLLGNYSKYD